jgi:small subunit ribosomal protein S6
MVHLKSLYETTFIINASIEDTQIEALVTHAQEVITNNGGEINVLNRWGRKRLAYPIEKKNNGYYVNIEFTGPGTVVARLEQVYTLDENILRFLTIKFDKKALQARRLGPKVAPDAVPAAAAPTPAPAPAPPEPERPRKDPLFEDEAAEPQAPKS